MALFHRNKEKSESGQPSNDLTYPLNPEGRLCPLLDDPDLLFDFYETAGLRKDLKKICKTLRWDGKPPVPYSIGPDALKGLLHSLLQSPAMRRKLAARDNTAGNSPALHQAIWAWIAARNPKLAELAEKHTHEKKERLFMAPQGLRDTLREAGENELLDEAGPLQAACLAAAFAMLQPEDASDLLSAAAEVYPEVGASLGLGG